MKLSELLKNVEVLNSLGDADVDITGVNIDSKRGISSLPFLAHKPMVTTSFPKPLSKGQLLYCVSISPTHVCLVLPILP